MLANICFKFHEDIFKRFLSYRADTIKWQGLLFSVSKGHNSKNRQSRAIVLMMVNICIEFDDDILNCFQITERTQLNHKIYFFSVSNGHNFKISQSRVTVLPFCTSSNVK